VKIGVLALQGDVREHIQSLSDCGVDALAVKTKSEIENISALVIPGDRKSVV
jgi:5'-phosphate synthase pdxT subunit